MSKKTILISLFIVVYILFDFSSFADTSDLLFTEEELDWLSEHPEITIGIMESWPPMDYVDAGGTPKGIGVDFIELINERLDDRLKIVSGTFSENYQKVIDYELDSLMDITDREDRKPYFNFTQSYVKVPHEIIAKKDGPYFEKISDLKNKTIAEEQGYYIVKYINANFPSIQVKEYSSTSNALDAVSKGEADAYIGNRAVVTYIIERELISNLQLQGKVSATSSTNSIGVRKDWPILASILDKVLSAIPEEEKAEIYKKWGSMASEESGLKLNVGEKKWLNEHQEITVAFDGDYAPYSFVDENGEFHGIAVDFMKEIALRAGIEVDIFPNGNWKILYDSALSHDVDVIATLVKRPEREAFFNFTEPYLSLAQYVVTSETNDEINEVDDLASKKVALVEKYSTTKYVLEDYPNITPYYVNSISEAL